MFANIHFQMAGHYSQIIQMRVEMVGSYVFLANSTIDMKMYIYDTFFKPLDPTHDLLAQIIRRSSSDELEFSLPLMNNTTYILVLRTFDSNGTGMFSITVTGPSKAIFTRIGEYSMFSR